MGKCQKGEWWEGQGEGVGIYDAIAVRYRIMYAAKSARCERQQQQSLQRKFQNCRQLPQSAKGEGRVHAGGAGAVIGPASVTYAVELQTKNLAA